jgi:hypothetical protein
LKKIENANFKNSADNILADYKFPSMQRVNIHDNQWKQAISAGSSPSRL